MKKLLVWLGLIFPVFAFADQSSLSFAPPPGDYSVIFLGNLFGVVDGVLHGTGSQIMGSMFAVFNSAVMALGGMIIMYTLMVSTMNTAHEGQMLGQKWNSIWVPIRSTVGLALLIPKASGYCMMQIFIMWIVVQGVGAADKVWDAALEYLNRGGVIVQAQATPSLSLKSANGEVAQGAGAILTGQVCMIGLQNALNDQYQMYQRSKDNNAGPCYGTPSQDMATICTTAVPDFLATVSAVSVQSSAANAQATSFQMPMPNFDSSSPYATLNGICGKIKWNSLSSSSLDKAQTSLKIDPNDMQTARMARAIAIQQMFVDLSSVAQVMVNNDPKLNSRINTTNTNAFYDPNFAQDQFGVPYASGNDSPCNAAVNCSNWGSDTKAASSNNSGPIFSGTEFQGAIADYTGVMLPTLNMIAKAQKDALDTDAIQFIEGAKNQGWLMAGSYFFDVVRLNQGNMSTDTTDKDTGLGGSTVDLSTLTGAFSNDGKSCQGSYKSLCTWFQGDSTAIKNIGYLMHGKDNVLSPPNYGATGTSTFKDGTSSSTVYGFIDNSMLVQLPGQAGQTGPTFSMQFKLDFNSSLSSMPEIDFPCGGSILGVCLGRTIANAVYNIVIRTVLDFVMQLITQVVTLLIMVILYLPLQGIAQVFKDGVSIIQQPGVNPIVALANMGATYINYANELWINVLTVTVLASVLGPFGMVIMAIITLVMPLLSAWVGIMVSIGFITAYYLPFLPYMLFTFGSIAWLMAVIEAMVAGPIVALGVTHPEGHDAFGKGEQAIMILMNVFLRPAMMIIGYVTGIAMSYVSVWMINLGFSNAIGFINGSGYVASGFMGSVTDRASNMSGYSSWALIYGFFFSVVIYTTMYLTVVQKSFSLITLLPDKVLRWIGGNPESIGAETANWADEGKQQVGKSGDETSKASGSMDQQMGGYGMKGASKVKGMTGGMGGGGGAGQSAGGGMGGGGGESTPSKGDK